MKTFKGKIEQYKSKKEVTNELDYYKSIILKKLEVEDYNSATEKIGSALTLIKEFSENFNFEEEQSEFRSFNQKIIEEIANHRKIYERRLKNLLKEQVNESNLENLMKLLVMLKSEVDQKPKIYQLENIQKQINEYFEFLKRLFIIISSYETVNYFEVLKKISKFIEDLESKNFPNLKDIIRSLHQNLLNRRILELSTEFDTLSVSEMIKLMELNQIDLLKFVNNIMQKPNNPIKEYNLATQEFVFKKKIASLRDIKVL